jgi:hypothetical protein
MSRGQGWFVISALFLIALGVAEEQLTQAGQRAVGFVAVNTALLGAYLTIRDHFRRNSPPAATRAPDDAAEPTSTANGLTGGTSGDEPGAGGENPHRHAAGQKRDSPSPASASAAGAAP